MTKIDIFSGFLGAGKTTLIQKLIREAYTGQKVVLIENEFGEIGIDGGFLQDAGIEITEMNSGCICCSLVGDFEKALQQVIEQYAPDRILIEPSGVGKLSDVIRAVQSIADDNAVLNGFTTVVDYKKCKMYMKNFGEFFNDQIEHASSIILSHTKGADADKLKACVDALREHNATAVIVTTDWDELTGAQILAAMENEDTLKAELEHLNAEEEICPECGHVHHHHDHDHDHEHHHHDGECCHHDHEHHHEHDHEHHHHHDGECCCHDHDHHHHHADDVFTSWGVETTNTYSKEDILAILTDLQDDHTYGTILRAKGMVPSANGEWIHFDYIPGEPDVRTGSAGITGRLCVIGAGIQEDMLAKRFGI